MAESNIAVILEIHICDCVFHCIAIASGYSHFLCTGKIPFLRAANLISAIYMACIFLQATYIMIPLFLELQAVNGLNNLPVLCLVYAVMQFPFCIFTLQGFMSAVPRDYEESARIDGATNIQLLLRVMVPLAKPWDCDHYDVKCHGLLE